jgi:antirestriction protein ArdC
MSCVERVSPYQKVTDQILELLAQGVVPWRRPWSVFQPQSVHGHVYRGINSLLLASRPYSDPRWLTFRMIQNLHGRLPRGEKATPVVFWSVIEREDEQGGTAKAVPFLKVFHVFNIEQTENLNLKPLQIHQCDGTPIERAEQVLSNLPWPITIKSGNAAYWSPSDPDCVTMPNIRSFCSESAYYGTLFHELGHFVGHSTRLNRDMSGRFRDASYAFEELVAELTSAFICCSIGLDNDLEQGAAYCESWRKVLSDGDPKMIIKASSLAQKAADAILGVTQNQLLVEAV